MTLTINFPNNTNSLIIAKNSDALVNEATAVVNQWQRDNNVRNVAVLKTDRVWDVAVFGAQWS